MCPDARRGFVCPICGTQQYEQVIVTLPSGGTRMTPFFACLGCRILFLDPVRFADRRRYVPGEGMSPPSFGRGWRSED
jgi:hypothetical protein